MSVAADVKVRPPKSPIELVPTARPERTNHRPPLTPLIGRADVLARLAKDLESGLRLMTVVGPPGIGKTRVAHAALERLGEPFVRKGGAWFCDLSEAKTETDLLFSVFSLVGDRAADGHLSHFSHAEVAARLDEALAESGPTLLVLDNFEQMAFAAGVVRRFCTVAPKLVVIVTSRERLSVEGEVVIELPPLGCPDEAAESHESSDAVALFVTRVREAGGTLGDDPEAVTEAVAEIVRRLEGIPLAIELAAARTRVLSAKDLAKRLALGQDVLGGAKRRDEGRHATVTSAIAWSWDLLASEEKEALARCSVFAGGFTMDAAEALLGEGGIDLVSALRDKSLVHTAESGRLALYVSIRAFAAKKLAADAQAEREARIAHARVFAAAARRFTESRSFQDKKPGAALFAGLRSEKENLVGALDHLRTLVPSAETARMKADLAGALALVLALPGETSIEQLSEALGTLEAFPDPPTEAQLLFARQGVSSSLGLYAECRADLARIRAMSGLPSGVRTLARVYQGIQLRYQGFAHEAFTCHLDAEAELRDAGLPRLTAMNDACMGRLHCDLGDVALSRGRNEKAFAASEALGDLWLGGLALANLAQLEQEHQDFARARELLERALGRLRDAGEVHSEAIYASVLGDLFFELGDLDVARRWYAEGMRFLGRLVTHRQTGILHASAAALEARAGNFAAAEAHLTTARAGVARLENPVVRMCLELHVGSVDLARAASDEERTARAEALRGRLDALAGDSEDARIVASSFDVRFAQRMLKRALALVAPPTSKGPLSLRLSKGARAFVSPEGDSASLERRGSLRKILLALAERHGTRPDEGLSVEDLSAAGWPGERVLVEAAQTRVRVAVATLRKLGLRHTLVTRDDGYLLDPNVRIEWEA